MNLDKMIFNIFCTLVATATTDFICIKFFEEIL